MKNQVERKIMSLMNFPALIRIFMVLTMTAPSMAAEP